MINKPATYKNTHAEAEVRPRPLGQPLLVVLAFLSSRTRKYPFELQGLAVAPKRLALGGLLRI